MTSDFERNASK